MGWYLGVIGRHHNQECNIFIHIYSQNKFKILFQIYLQIHRLTVGFNNEGINSQMLSLILHIVMFIYWIKLRGEFQDVEEYIKK